MTSHRLAVDESDLSDNGNSGYGGPLVTDGAVQLMLHNNAYETWSRDRFGTKLGSPQEGYRPGYRRQSRQRHLSQPMGVFHRGGSKSMDAAGVFAPSVVGSNFTYTFPVSNRIDPNAYDVRYSTDLNLHGPAFQPGNGP